MNYLQVLPVVVTWSLGWSYSSRRARGWPAQIAYTARQRSTETQSHSVSARSGMGLNKCKAGKMDIYKCPQSPPPPISLHHESKIANFVGGRVRRWALFCAIWWLWVNIFQVNRHQTYKNMTMFREMTVLHLFRPGEQAIIAGSWLVRI